MFMDKKFNVSAKMLFVYTFVRSGYLPIWCLTVKQVGVYHPDNTKNKGWWAAHY